MLAHVRDNNELRNWAAVCTGTGNPAATALDGNWVGDSGVSQRDSVTAGRVPPPEIARKPRPNQRGGLWGNQSPELIGCWAANNPLSVSTASAVVSDATLDPVPMERIKRERLLKASDRVSSSRVAETSQVRRDEIILENLPLVKAIAVRVRGNLPAHVELDDLVHAGILGLLDAVIKFDPDKMVSFSSYAKHRIKGAILDNLRQLDWASRDLRRRQKQVEAATHELTCKLNRAPSETELAARMGIDVKGWRQLAVELHVLGPISISQRPADQEDLPAPDFPARADLQPDNMCSHRQRRSALENAMTVLPERHQKVVSLYYTNELTMKEIGDVLGINESRVSQIHKTALQKMATALKGAGVGSSAAF